jgi:ubiquinone/menaquinone biosynthesis C-methylase UbiE
LADLRAWLPTVMSNRRVLEIAAGTGYWTDAYCDDAMSVVATDVNAETLEVARARRSWPDSVRLAEADAFDLSSVDGGFDAAFAGFFWSHLRLDQLGLFFSALARRLEPGAVVVLIDNRYVEGSNHPVSRTDAAGNTYQQRQLDDGTSWEVLKNFPTVATLEACLRPFSTTMQITALTYFWTAQCQFGAIG